jgi:MerR family copper efflux transcriptional regulator
MYPIPRPTRATGSGRGPRPISWSLYHGIGLNIKAMRIGELAGRADVHIQTVRFYEREGLLRPPERTASGYRSYAESDLERVRFIRLCQGLGFTLREIHQLLQLHRELSQFDGKTVMKAAAVHEIVALANERLAVIDEKLATLTAMRAELTSLVKALTGGGPSVCPVSR